MGGITRTRKTRRHST